MRWTFVLAAVLAATPLWAQEIVIPPNAGAPSSPGGTALTLQLDAELLRDLPTSDNLFQVLETMATSVIADRFTGGGLAGGQGARVGGFFGSSSQTAFRLGDLSIADPTGSGTSLLFPDLSLWQRVRVTTGMMPANANAPGLAIAFDPIAPTVQWIRTMFVSTSHGPLAGDAPSTGAPAIAQLAGWNRGSVTATGPLIEGRLGGGFAGTWNQSTEFDRGEASSVSASQGSVMANLVFTPDSSSELTTIGWLQRSAYPFSLRTPFNTSDASTVDHAGHIQAAWERHPSQALRVRAFGGFTRRTRTEESLPVQATFERLTDGPLEQTSFAGPSAVDVWTVGARLMSPTDRAATERHHFEASAEVSGSHSRQSSLPATTVGELVNRLPARVWKFSQPQNDSIHSSTAFTAYVSDRMTFGSRVTVDAALALDTVSGSAQSAVNGISWQTLLPRASLQWTLTDRGLPTLFAGYRRSAFQLPLDLLAIGDPSAPVADVYRWDGPAGGSPSLSAIGPLVARAGYGTAGDPTRSAIADDLRRPYLDEFVAGFSIRPISDLLLQVTGVKRRERDLFALTNTGVSVSDYSMINVPDVGIDVATSADDGNVTIYNRTPASFGKDRFLLTTNDDEASSESVEVSIRLSKPSVLLFVGGSASRTDGPAANRGYGPLENDEGIVGELFTNPNADVSARGRLFNDRAYTGKVIGVFHLPYDFRLGLLARYQDGQPFARVVVMPGLNQGAEAVRAYANGGSRFTFTGTLDMRLQKGLTIGRVRADAVFDAYNLANMSNEVEEDIVTGPGFRTITAVQPPRAFHVGFRVTF